MKKNITTVLISFVICFVSCNSISKNFESDDKDSLVIQLITYVLDQAHYLDIEIDDNFSEIKKNESIYVPKGCKHRLSNLRKKSLIIIEIQSGSYLGEDDIIRFEDDYGRK